MTRILKEPHEVAKRAAREGIGRALKDGYNALTREALPNSLTALLALLESAERIARIKDRVGRLRQGLEALKKK